MAKTRDALSVEQDPARKGLQVRRLFTTKGTSPYDELAWERRDAVITNWRDGTVAFEQRGLDFPATWSQNATNIVAQKYFRGPLGTPQREHSVRQMVDRVAGTITDWGIKDGYFAGPDGAEAFRAELTHLLVNQKAAFNSPVWFNVGVEPDPQASACFILAVEDTMPSILNWYVEEGMIFKGGSGSGVNLSTIRSSREPLGNGGEASGPVSFMRGADASAGTIKSGGKCFREGTLVATPSGMQPIERLRVGDEVLTHRGPRAIADFMRNGRRQCYRVRTREGYEVEVTAGHKFAYWNSIDGHFDVKPIEEFKAGDALYALLEPCSGGTKIPLLPPEIADPAHATTTVEMSLPTELDERLAYVVGLMYGDGELRTKYPYRVRVAFAKDAAGRLSAQRFRDYSRDLFGEEPLLLGDADGCQQFGFTRKRLVEFLVANGIAKGKADSLGFPSMLFRAEPGVRAAFIAGVIDADGSYQRRGSWSISSIDRTFLVDLQRLLLTLGVPSKLKLSREQNGAWRRLYRLSIIGHTFVQRLVEHIAPHSAKAQVMYEPSPGADKGWGYRPSLLSSLAARVRQRGGYGLIERSVGMNETSGYGAVATLASYPETAVASYAQELSTCVQLTLEAVTATEVAETYDIEVEDVHLLSANGIYSSNTRRAAKMVILNVDHPDVRDFIWCKAREEHKARVLRDAGFDMDLDGRDSISIQYQNANNSVRVTDEFMRAYEQDQPFDLKAVLDGHTIETVRARDLMREIAQAAWECADPGMQYDTTINDWHTTPESGRINASNPCFTGETLVHTDKGLIRFDELARRAVDGETFGIYTHDATNTDAPAETVTLSSHEAVMVTGTNPVVRLRFSNGAEVRCTPNHRFWTANRGWVAARDLESADRVRLLDHETPATAAERRLPVATDVAAYTSKGDHAAPMALPEKWDDDFAHLLGWLVGDGSFSGDVISAVYGSAEDREVVLPRHQRLFAQLNGGRSPKVSVQANGTMQLRLSRRALALFFEALGLKRVKAADKDVPWSVFEAPEEAVTAFLRGLFDADGTVVNGATTRYVGLGSRSLGLLRSVQALLASLGIGARIYPTTKGGLAAFSYVTRAGEERSYTSSPGYDLRISGDGIDRFAERIGFDLPSKSARLEQALTAGRYAAKRTATLISREDGGVAVTYNLTEPKNHSYIVQGFVVANCSEYMHLDNSACNLASLNLLKFLGDDGNFDVSAFRHAVEIVFLAQEIIVGNSSYPTEKIARNAKDFRQLGLGYANLGALLMALGKAYDSDGGRAWAGAITALMTGHAYRTSARIAQVTGPFAGYPKNREPMLRVMRKHRAEVGRIQSSLVQPDLFEAARTAWDEAIQFGEEFGYRNSQATVLAPTGTIGLLMDCDTTGIEPDLALVKTKKLVGGGSMSIVNQTVPRALRTLGYADEHVQAITEYVAVHNSVKGAPALREEHYQVFDCAMGDSPIHYMGHIRMMAAAQPFISGAISKTVNMPESVTVEEVERAYVEGWKLGLKALAIYRDNCKVGQPLSADKKVTTDSGAVIELDHAPVRRRLPKSRPSKTTSFRVGDIEGYLTAGSYPDDGLGEIFVKVSKQGSTLSGVMDAFAIAVSVGLQYGVPLEALVAKFVNMIFEPNGMTDDPDVRIAQSLVDYLARRLAIDYLDPETRQALGIKTTAERIAELNGTEAPAAGIEAAPAAPEPAEAEPAPTVPAAPAAAAGPTFTPGTAAVDAPYCSTCGVRMRPAGSCFVCESCGTTSGCS